MARSTLDIIDKVVKDDNPLVPSRNLAKEFMPASTINFRENYIKTGLIHRELFIESGLKPTDKVLEIGSGCGRMAIPLLDYLTTGTYDGLDISHKGVQWCKENITTRNADFQFSYLDIYNRQYNPDGNPLTPDFKLPRKDGEFNFIFLTSVFTHMLPDDVRLYLYEIKRLLAPNGICFMSFFLINDNSHKSRTHSFQYHHAGFHSEYSDIVERAIAYDQSNVYEMIDNAGLNTKHTMYGSWTGNNAKNFQDVLIVTS